MAFNIHQHLTHALPLELEGQKVTIIGTISSVVEDSKKPKSKFILDVSKVGNNQYTWYLPAKIQLSWDAAGSKLQTGDTWQFKVKLKRPRNYANPGSFDTEKYFFQQRVVALGYVVAGAENHLLQQNVLYRPINLLRQRLLQIMRASLKTHNFGEVITALVLGSKGAMPEEHSAILQNTGTIHLLAISGLHIGLLASMCFVLVKFLWRLMPVRWMILPAPMVAACAAILLSGMYALMAGFSVATQRALIMVVVFLSGIILKRKISSIYSFSLALILVLLWDPFAILSVGFWFSFGAVALLMYAMRSRRDWLRPQLILACGLLPLNAMFFAKHSLIGPIANSIAIPWVGVAVLPLSLLAVLLLPLLPSVSTVCWQIAAKNFAFLWPLLTKLSYIPTLTWQLPLQNFGFSIFTSLLGTLWLFMPRGLPGRWWGMFGFVPLLFVFPQQVPYGQAEFTLLDVGQGLAAVVRTQQHVLVYDTGAKLNSEFDLGSRVVAPFLQTKGVRKIDTLMISHGDNDHIGGARGLLNKFSAQTIVTSDAQDLAEYQPMQCRAGQQWAWDGVHFTVLHPQVDIYNKKRNDHSCVLLVQAGNQKLLLTGDIEKHSERQLIAHYGEDLQADIMLVPHHGSKTSSSAEFLQTVRPKYALIPVGYKNQYGHPKEPVLQRYREQNIAVLRTEHDGAISFRLGGDLKPSCFRRTQHGFWLD